jgi:outer membrane protein TolC
MIAGCHRSFYRRQADAEARRLILEKAVDPRWSSADGRVDIDPQSRMFNPFSADHAPLPPDDPTSHRLMHHVDGRQGYPHWHANGDTDVVENPMWLSYLPVDENGQSVLSLERAYELALLHSPDFQAQRETLYLSALDVSLQRFGFDSQLFAGFNQFISTSGRLRDGTGRSSTNLTSGLGVNGGGINLNRLGITGATFTAGLANTLMWNLAGNNTQTASGLFDFSIIQPLLRGAGRDRILESLTQSERTLLANIRQYERFRRGFYLQIATGRNSGAGPNRQGNFPGLAAGASLNPGGYFGLLQQQQQIRNLEFNLRLLEGVLEQFQTFQEEDRIDSLQVRQFQSTVFQQQQNLLNAKVSYQTALDNFKQVLGLPPYLDITIEDPLLDRFKIIDDSISGRLADASKLRIEVGSIIDELVDLNSELSNIFVEEEDERQNDAANQKDTELIQSLVKQTLELEPLIQKARAMANSVGEEDFNTVKNDIEKLDTLRPKRLAYLRKLRRDIANGKLPSEVEPQVFSDQSIPESKSLAENLNDPDNQRSLSRRLSRIEVGLEKLLTQLQSLEKETKELDGKEVGELIANLFQRPTPDLLTDLDGTILELALIQAEARSNVIEIETVEISSDQAFDVARCFRRDWMNARAGLVDSWRRIEFVADQLESQVDLVFEGDVGTASDNPFSFRYETGQLRAGLRVDAPIVRQSERNDYREALIIYQQARRTFYQFEDDVSRNLRLIVRNLDRNKVLFELNRQSIQVNIDAVELSRFRLEQPPRPGAQSAFGQTTARDLSQAINGLNSVQNQYVQSWVQYEVLRRSLDFDLGTMQLDQSGQWIDPGVFDESTGQRAAAIFGTDGACGFCDGIYRADFVPEQFESVEYSIDSEIDQSSETPPAPLAESEMRNAEQSPLESFEVEETESGLLEPLLKSPSPDVEQALPLGFE